MSRDGLIRLATSALLVAAGGLLAWISIGGGAVIGIDDADITQLYARNLAAGHGYVYTPGYERVEGSTSLLWTALSALAWRLTPHGEAVQLAMTLAMTVWTVVLARRMGALIPSPASAGEEGARRAIARWEGEGQATHDPHPTSPAGGRGAGDLALCLWILLIPEFFRWQMLALMDVTLWTLAFTGLAFAILRQLRGEPAAWSLAAWSAVAMLTRPEAMLLVPVALAIGTAFAWRRQGRAALRSYLPPLALALSLLAAVTLWRLAYFGWPFPNTYYAKVSSAPLDNLAAGAKYLARFVLLDPVGLIALAATGAALAGWRHAPVLAAIAALALAVVAAVVLEGGDHFAGFRALQPALPLMGVALVALWLRLPRPARRAVPILAALLLVWRAVALFGPETLGNEFKLARFGRQIGAALAPFAERYPGLVLGETAAGGVAYEFPGRVFDVLGLNDTAVAHANGRRTGVSGHSAFDLEIFWRTKPDLFLVQGAPADAAANPSLTVLKFSQKLYRGLFADPRLHDAYRPVILIGAGGLPLAGFAHRAFLARAAADPAVHPFGWDRVTLAPPDPE